MTRDEAIDALNEVLVALATTTIGALPTEVRLGPEDGMTRECVLDLDHVCAVANGPPRWPHHEPGSEDAALCRALDVATGCS